MGGGTVLMLRHNHRASKHVDIFCRGCAGLGYVKPRMGGVAVQMAKYEEGPDHIKLHFPEGEVDFVASPLLLTASGFVVSELLGRAVLLESRT